MRAFVFLLILGNLLFFAWAQGYFGSSSNPDSLRVQQQLLADQVKIVSREFPPPLSQKSEDPPPIKADKKRELDFCLQLKDIPAEAATAFANRLAEQILALKITRTNTEGNSSYWVHIPPLASRQEAENKADELKNLHISDFFIVQENGTNNRAISLGLFSTNDAAATHLEALRAKGVRSARITERITKPSVAALEIRAPESEANAIRQAISETLPDSSPSDCPTQ